MTSEPLVSNLTPPDVASWLSMNGWSRLTRNPQAPAALWTNQRNQEVLQPLLRDAKDYQGRLSDLLKALERAEAGAVSAIAQDMLAQGADVCEWRADHGKSDDYSVALEDGFQLVRGARNAFIAAANAAQHPRGYYGRHTTKLAREHANLVRMGQTKPGSYVIPIISRIPGATLVEDDAQGRFDIPVSAQPFERQVMAQLAQSLRAVEDLAVRSDRKPTMRELNESVGRGVSHELCIALADVLDAKTVGNVDIEFSWARRVPNHPDVVRVDFPQDAALVVRDMGERLRGSQQIGEQVVTGEVRGHRKDYGEQEGTVKIRTRIGDSLRLVTATLTEEQMHEALMAADQKKPVFVKGQLVRGTGRAWHFRSVSQFGISEAAPLEWVMSIMTATDSAEDPLE